MTVSEYMGPPHGFKADGAPPGYTATRGGSRLGPVRQPAVRGCFDEIEKALRRVHNILPADPGDGRVMTGQGRRTFRNRSHYNDQQLGTRAAAQPSDFRGRTARRAGRNAELRSSVDTALKRAFAGASEPLDDPSSSSTRCTQTRLSQIVG